LENTHQRQNGRHDIKTANDQGQNASPLTAPENPNPSHDLACAKKEDHQPYQDNGSSKHGKHASPGVGIGGVRNISKILSRSREKYTAKHNAHTPQSYQRSQHDINDANSGDSSAGVAGPRSPPRAIVEIFVIVVVPPVTAARAIIVVIVPIVVIARPAPRAIIVLILIARPAARTIVFFLLTRGRGRGRLGRGRRGGHGG